MIGQAIWQKERLPCCFNFKRQVIDHYTAFIILIGYCKTCQIDLKAKCYNRPIPDCAVTFTITTADSRGIPHTEKKRLAGPRRKLVKEDLKHKKPKNWRRDEAHKNMKYGDCEPPTLYSLPVLQKAHQQATYDELGLKQGEDLFISLTSSTFHFGHQNK